MCNTLERKFLPPSNSSNPQSQEHATQRASQEARRSMSPKRRNRRPKELSSELANASEKKICVKVDLRSFRLRPWLDYSIKYNNHQFQDRCFPPWLSSHDFHPPLFTENLSYITQIPKNLACLSHPPNSQPKGGCCDLQ